MVEFKEHIGYFDISVQTPRQNITKLFRSPADRREELLKFTHRAFAEHFQTSILVDFRGLEVQSVCLVLVSEPGLLSRRTWHMNLSSDVGLYFTTAKSSPNSRQTGRVWPGPADLEVVIRQGRKNQEGNVLNVSNIQPAFIFLFPFSLDVGKRERKSSVKSTHSSRASSF